MAIGQLPELTSQISVRTDASALGVRSANELVKAWEIGQLLRARVAVDEGSQQRFIEIGNTRIKTDRQFPFSPGQLLTIRVDQIGNKPELRILTPPSLNSSSATTTTNTPLQGTDARLANATQLTSTTSTSATAHSINQAIRAVIGHQAPTNILLPILSQTINAITKLPLPDATVLAAATGTNAKQASANIVKPSLELELKAAAQKIRDAIPLLSQLRQPLQVKQSGLNSGVFFESKLSLSTAPLNVSTLAKDIKPALLQLAAIVRQALAQDSKLSPALTARLQEKLGEIIGRTKSPTLAKSAEAQTRIDVARLLQLQPLQQLLKTSESLLSRIQLNQLSSLAQSNETNQVWFLEIPYTHNERQSALQFRISKDDNNEDDNEDDTWRLEFSFELGDHGTVLSDIRLKGKSINLRFVAETDSGLKLLQNNIRLLDERLRQLGFDVNTQPPQQNEIADLLRPHSLNKLLDTHA